MAGASITTAFIRERIFCVLHIHQPLIWLPYYMQNLDRKVRCEQRLQVSQKRVLVFLYIWSPSASFSPSTLSHFTLLSFIFAASVDPYLSSFSLLSHSLLSFDISKMFVPITLALSLGGLVYSQQAGTLTQETHPSLPWSSCTASGCKKQTGSITLDANWRWVHSTDDSTNCYTVSSI